MAAHSSILAWTEELGGARDHRVEKSQTQLTK